MEEIRNAIYNEIDIVTERDYAIIDKLTKIEIQSKLLGLNIIASESYLTILQMPKQRLINFILQLNLFYAEESEDIESAPSDMNDTQEGMDDDQYGRNGTNNFYGYHGDVNDYYQYNNQDHYYWQQNQWQNGMYFQQWNGQYQNNWNESN